jgi:hypothetical protein
VKSKLALARFGLVGLSIGVSLIGSYDPVQASQITAKSEAVPKVTRCAKGDQPEVALQGQVPAAIRATGFTGFNCNLKLMGQWRGDGGTFSSAMFKDRAGHRCFYFASPYNRDRQGNEIKREYPGVAVVDISDSSRPVFTTSLTTPAMLDPWESLRVNPRRQVLAADFGPGAPMGSGGPELDLYDLSGDCRYPQLISSTPMSYGATTDTTTVKMLMGHEGSFAPDGLTYYVGDITNGAYFAVDIMNMAKPKVIARVDTSAPGSLGGGPHGLSISDDGNRGYFTSGDIHMKPLPDTQRSKNGFNIVDISEVQARKADPQMRVIASVEVRDGTAAQHTLPFKIAGRQYLVHVDESGGLLVNPKGACEAGLTPYPMARIYDIADETHPKLISKLMLETHELANCARVLPDIVGVGGFTYGSHYCSVDNRANATVLACAYFNSGIRVFDIRDPARPKEIAYFNPPGAVISPSGEPLAQQAGPGLCPSRLDFDFQRKELITMCQHTGMLVMQFENNVWPMRESTPSIEQNN